MDKKPIKIGVDIDGVIGNFIKHFSMLLREMYRNHIPIIENSDNVPEWDMHKWFPLTEEEIDKGFEEIGKSNSFWLQLELINQEHWERFIKEFNNDDYDVYFITSRVNGIGIRSQTINWLEWNGWKNPQVILSTNKPYVINGIGINYFIDDKDDTVFYAHNLTFAKCYLYKYPHNCLYYSNLNRLNNLDEFTNLILNENE